MPSAATDQRVPWDSLLPVTEGVTGLTDMPFDAGYQAWTYDPMLANATSAALASAKLTVVRLKISAPIVATSIQYVIIGAGSTLTSGQNFVGVWSPTGALIASSADTTSAWGGTGLITTALASGPFTLTTNFVYVGFQVNGTTGPTLSRMTAPSAGVVFSNSNLVPNPFRHGVSTGAAGTTSLQATLPALTQGTINPWVAII